MATISQEAVQMSAFTIPSHLVMRVNHAGVSSSHWRGELRIPNGCHILKTICNVNYVIRNPHLSLCLQIRKSILSWNLYLIFIPKPGINPSASVYYKSRKVKTWTKQNIQKKRRRKSKGGGGRRERRRRNLNIWEKRKNRKLTWRKSSKEPYRNISLFKALSPFTIYPELGLPWWLSSKSACQCRRPEFNPWVRKITWRRKCNPLQYSCLGNSMDQRAWWATVHGVTKNWIWLSI